MASTSSARELWPLTRGENINVVVMDTVDRIRKAEHKRSARTALDRWKHHRILSDERDCAIERIAELLAESESLIFVPVAGAANVFTSRSANRDAKLHFFGKRSSRTRPHDSPASGFFA